MVVFVFHFPPGVRVADFLRARGIWQQLGVGHGISLPPQRQPNGEGNLGLSNWRLIPSSRKIELL
jgi:hypothetical protein